MTCDYTDHGLFGQVQPRPRLQQAGHAGRRRGLSEDALFQGEQMVGGNDLIVGNGIDSAAGLVAGGESALPTGRVTDADGGGYGLRILHGLTPDYGRGAGGLPAHHPRLPGGDLRLIVLDEPAPVGGNVPRVAHRDEQQVGGVTQSVHDLEGGGLLSVDTVGVDGVDHRHGVAAADLARDLQGGIKVPLNGEDTGAVRDRLSQLTACDIAAGH